MRKFTTILILLLVVSMGVLAFVVYKQHGLLVAIDARMEAQDKRADRLSEAGTATLGAVHELRKELDRQRELYPVSRGGQHIRRVLTDCEVTWYANNGITASGYRTVDEQTIAVDPSVIPLGSKMVVVMPDGTEYEGWAHDTGGAVKGHILDIYTDKGQREAFRRGRTYGARAYIIH